MTNAKTKTLSIVLFAYTLFFGMSFSGAALGQDLNVSHKAYAPTLLGAEALTEEVRESAKSRLPMLTDFSQLPTEVQDALRSGESNILAPTGYGTGNHPFTTKLASITPGNRVPTNLVPFRQTGKLWMRFGSDWYVCTASVVERRLVVTAAHCLHNFGEGSLGWADEVIFEPARFGSGSGAYNLPYGAWEATSWWIPGSYFNGTDVCTTSGIVCENDIAVVVIANNSSGQVLGNRINRYFFYTDTDPYTSFSSLTAAQFTQLGYPVAFESGQKMIRTDSLGYTATPNNVIIGSDQTGGSSGGPWIMNFGSNPNSTSTTPSWNQPRRVAAVTSWGYTNSNVKVQGASRFNTNTHYTTVSNIESLISSACSGGDADACY